MKPTQRWQLANPTLRLLSDYTPSRWFKVRRSNLFIIPFAIVVLLTYAFLTRGLNVGMLLSSLILGLPIGYSIALIETHSQDLQRICPRHQFSVFLLMKPLRLSIYFSLLFILLTPLCVLLDFHFGDSIFVMGIGRFLRKQFLEMLAVSLGISFLANLLVELNRKLGPGVFLNLLTGRYHRPEPQNRTFLFLDIKNSTTIAEEMGEIRFSRFLQDFFYDISDTISQYRGEIYQYVGDEVVISWKTRDGEKDNRAVDCFLAIQERIEKIADYYQQHYGQIPTFKGSIHTGRVVIAEVGKIKSEIAYHGDVLNTASRILDLCRTLEHDLLISAAMNDKLTPNAVWLQEPMGSFYLKGKTRGITLYAVERRKKGRSQLVSVEDALPSAPTQSIQATAIAG